MFETLALVNGKIPTGMLSGGAASVTGNLDDEGGLEDHLSNFTTAQSKDATLTQC